MDLVSNTAATLVADGGQDARSARHFDRYLIDARHPCRTQVEQFIGRRFFEAHGARISRYMPVLLALFDSAGEVLAAVGIRDAGNEALFLEYYLDSPVERAIATRSGRILLPPERDSIVEIGNLASIDRRASRELFALLAAYLNLKGYEWAVFTGCSSLHRMFDTLGIETFALGRALQSRLPVEQQTWGSYYEDNPMVVAGRVSGGYRALGNPGDAPTAVTLS